MIQPFRCAALRGPIIFAHRGFSSRYPENTRTAFQAALEAGAGGIELDIQLSADGELICLHDYDLLRTTNARTLYPGHPSYAASDFGSGDILAMDAGAWFGPEFAGERVPKLSELLSWSREAEIPPLLLIELKDIPSYALRLGELLERLVTTLEAAGLPCQGQASGGVIVQSFYPQALIPLASTMPLLSRVQLVPAFDRFIPSIYPDFESAVESVRQYAHGMALPDEEATTGRIATMRHAGLACFVWTVNDARRIRELSGFGVDAVITNVPNVAVSAISAAG